MYSVTEPVVTFAVTATGPDGAPPVLSTMLLTLMAEALPFDGSCWSTTTVKPVSFGRTVAPFSPATCRIMPPPLAVGGPARPIVSRLPDASRRVNVITSPVLKYILVGSVMLTLPAVMFMPVVSMPGFDAATYVATADVPTALASDVRIGDPEDAMTDAASLTRTTFAPEAAPPSRLAIRFVSVSTPGNAPLLGVVTVIRTSSLSTPLLLATATEAARPSVPETTGALVRCR